MTAAFHASASALKRLVCAGLAAELLLCAGCGAHPAAPAASSSPASAVETFGPEEPSQTAPAREPIAQVTAISPDYVPAFADLGGGRVLSCWTEYTSEEDIGTTHLDVIDLSENRVERSAETAGYLFPERCFSDGTVLLRSYEQDCYFFLDEDLTWTQVDVPTTDGLFSPDHSRFYYTWQECLYAFDLDTGQTDLMTLPDGIRPLWIEACHPTQDILSCWVYTSLYSGETCYAVIDCDSGELLLLQDALTSPSFSEDSFQSLTYNYDTGVSQLVWGSLRGGEALQCRRLEDAGGQYTDLQLLAGSDLALNVSYPEWDEETGELIQAGSTELYRLEADGLSVCSLADWGFEGTLFQAVYLPEQQLILGGVYSLEDCATVVLIDPSQLTFTAAGIESAEAPERIDQSLLSEGIPGLENPDLAQARARADALEAQYDIHILLSSQCAGPCSASGYDVATTEDWEEEAGLISQSLDALEAVLANYPEGFFSQFRSDSGETGVYFMAVGSISSEEQDSVAAFEFGSGMREFIAFDISLFGLSANLYHEIWHATENKIDRTDYMGFYSEDWSDCNPEGYEYLYSYNLDDMGEDLWQWTYFGGYEVEEICFVDSYSHTYPKEDRARIMEYVMDSDQVAEELLASPHICQKLRLMCDGIRAAFDTSEWETPRWEQLLVSKANPAG